MSTKKITISPKTKVGELLDAFPELESVLMEMSPAFEKLKNPILRKSVARLATIQQVDVVGMGGIPVPIINMLKAKGYKIYSIQKGNNAISYIIK